MTAIKREREKEEGSEGSVFPGLRGLITSRRSQFALLLYFLFPLFAGFTSAMQGSGRTAGWPLGYSLAYYLPLALVMMWSSGIATHLLAKPARALKLPLWALLIIGVLAAGEFVKMYVRLIVPVFDRLLPASATGGRVAEFTVAGNVQAALPTILTWLLLNLLAWRVFGIARFGYAAPPGVASSKWSQNTPSSPEFERIPNCLSRANLSSIEMVEAIEAQQHYIKIHTRSNPRTVLYRFGDAIGEFDDNLGVQVHRSWWVNTAHVARLKRDGDRLIVAMNSGLEVPVSRSFARQAKDAFG